MCVERVKTLCTVLIMSIFWIGCPGEESRPEPAPDGAGEEVALTVWHAWPEQAVSVLERVVDRYEQESGTTVELVSFDTEQALVDQLPATANGPDLFFGSHLRVDDLLERGTIGAYCLPDQCEECRGATPPAWCPVALGQFGDSLIDRFELDAGYCEPGGCPVCFGDNPPHWCRYASGEVQTPIDLPRALFSTIADGKPFPLGIPVWWEYGAIVVDRAWFEERGVALPADVASLGRFLNEHSDDVWVDERALDGSPVPMPFDLGRFAGDPNPQPSVAALFIGSSARLPELGGALAEPVVLELGEYRPAALVHGAFVRDGTDRRSDALALMYELTYPSFQQELFDATGALPAASQALDQVGQGLPEGAIEVGTTALPLEAGQARGELPGS